MSFWSPVCDIIKLTSSKERNKYQQALNNLQQHENNLLQIAKRYNEEPLYNSQKDIDTLQELINKMEEE